MIFQLGGCVCSIRNPRVLLLIQLAGRTRGGLVRPGSLELPVSALSSPAANDLVPLFSATCLWMDMAMKTEGLPLLYKELQAGPGGFCAYSSSQWGYWRHHCCDIYQNSSLELLILCASGCLVISSQNPKYPSGSRCWAICVAVCLHLGGRCCFYYKPDMAQARTVFLSS